MKSTLNNDTLKLGHAYFFAKEIVKRKGYYLEIESQELVCFDEIDESYFIQQTAWVILNSGMRESVIRKHWPGITNSFLNWSDLRKIIEHKEICIQSALKIFNYPTKIHSILKCIEIINESNFDTFKQKILNEGVDFLETLPFIGRITKYHLAKNLGINISKPDRHLQRISDFLNFNDVHEMCSLISRTTYEKESVIDLVVWRYATLHPDYLENIRLYFSIPKMPRNSPLKKPITSISC